MVIGIATPVFQDNHLFVSSFYDGSLLLRVNPGELAVEEIWRRKGPSETDTESLHCCISTPLLQEDYIYGVDSHGELRCLDLKTGDRIWESLEAVPKARWSNIHIVRNGDKVWMFNERGELIICGLSPEGFEEISRTKLIDPTEGQLNQRGGVCWSHPAYAYRHIYIRNDKELICADLSARN
jgi:outer membrane protein assembly factor BamB